MLEDFQGWKLSTRAQKRFPLIKDEGRDIDQANHSRCVVGRLRDDEAAIRVADQKRRSFQLRQNLTRGGHVVSQGGGSILLRDHKMTLRLQRRDYFAPAGSVGPETVD